MIEKTKEMELPINWCPQCEGKIHWKVVHSELGAPMYNGHCPKCAIVFRNRETPEVTKGRVLAKELIGVGAMDKRITSQSCDTQIGILREKQHCKTCGGLSWECKCKDCKCINCMENKHFKE